MYFDDFRCVYLRHFEVKYSYANLCCSPHVKKVAIEQCYDMGEGKGSIYHSLYIFRTVSK